jgi:hypothetical protein
MLVGYSFNNHFESAFILKKSWRQASLLHTTAALLLAVVRCYLLLTAFVKYTCA